jgi:hypothetical protein
VHSRAGAVLPISRIREDGREWCCASTAFLNTEIAVGRGDGGCAGIWNAIRRIEGLRVAVCLCQSE